MGVFDGVLAGLVFLVLVMVLLAVGICVALFLDWFFDGIDRRKYSGRFRKPRGCVAKKC